MPNCLILKNHKNKNMKNLMTLKMAIVFGILGIMGCAQAPKSDEAKIEPAKAVKETTTTSKSAVKDLPVSNLTVDTQNSIISWIGTKPTKQHNGTINIKSGGLKVAGNEILAGEFVMDMGTVKVLDMDEENNNNLAGHLMSDDFFKSEKYPTATFTITKVEPFKAQDGEKPLLRGATHTITGNLKMLAVTNSITFPAKVKISDKGVKANANFNIDRTQWNINYNSEQSLGNKFIKPTVNIGIVLQAK